MRANEFVKKFGWGEAISLIDASKICGIDKSVVDIEELKRLVDSHELVREHGSIGRAKDYAQSRQAEIDALQKRIDEALHAADESCGVSVAAFVKLNKILKGNQDEN